MIPEETINWIQSRKTGCILYTSPASFVRESSLKLMARVALCESFNPVCDCQHCHTVKEGTHPHTSLVTDETFDEKMRVLYSYPTPIVLIAEAQRLSISRQTKLLIWLESIGKARFVFLSSDSEYTVLPTIRSRSVVYTEIPRFRLSEEEDYRTRIFIQSIFSGKERFESIATPEDSKKMAYNMRHHIIREMEARLMKPPKKMIAGSDLELTTLMKVLELFLADPSVHNLRLLLMGFMMNPLQSLK